MARKLPISKIPSSTHHLSSFSACFASDILPPHALLHKLRCLAHLHLWQHSWTVNGVITLEDCGFPCAVESIEFLQSMADAPTPADATQPGAWRIIESHGDQVCRSTWRELCSHRELVYFHIICLNAANCCLFTHQNQALYAYTCSGLYKSFPFSITHFPPTVPPGKWPVFDPPHVASCCQKSLGVWLSCLQKMESLRFEALSSPVWLKSQQDHMQHSFASFISRKWEMVLQ